MVKVWNGGLFGKHPYLPTESSPPTPRKVGSGRCSACVQGLDQSTQLVPLTFLCSPVGRVIKVGLTEPDPFLILGEYLIVRFQKGLVLSASFLSCRHQGCFLGVVFLGGILIVLNFPLQCTSLSKHGH